jgi:hypothetical protein
LRKNSIAIALGLCAVMLLATAAPAQHKRTTKHRTVRHRIVRHRVVRKKSTGVTSGAETGLVGIKLFDTGTRVVAVYGSPDVIEAVTTGGTTAGPGGGAAGGGRGGGLPGFGGGGGKGGGGSAASSENGVTGVPGDFDFGNGVLDRQGRPMVPGMPQGGPPGGPGGPVGPPGTGGGGGMGGGNTDRVLYTRWVYNRNASKYGFILDQYNRVVQCEAIGLQSGKASTRRGITFGSSFAQIIKRYGAPDGYEISGDNIVVRYLSKAKCAFRLNRLGENKPDVVTGIVVAAGKR